MTTNSLAKIKYNFEQSKWENLTMSQVQKWERLYPDIDVAGEMTKMVRWLDKCEDKKIARKKDWKKFIVNWLIRSQTKKERI